MTRTFSEIAISWYSARLTWIKGMLFEENTVTSGTSLNYMLKLQRDLISKKNRALTIKPRTVHSD